MEEWIVNLFTVEYGLYFVAGFLLAWGWHYMKCIRTDKRVRIKWNYLAYAAALIVFLYSVVETSQNSKCVHEFNEALRQRSIYSEQNDHWSRVQREAFADWLSEIVVPPAPIEELRLKNPTDPQITVWARTMTNHYSGIVQNAQREQDEALKERAKHPLPQPACNQ